jgi:uncharacterized protein YqgC (DUF456 family)
MRNPSWLDVPRNEFGRFVSRGLCGCPANAVQTASPVIASAARQTASEAAKSTVRGAAPVAAVFFVVESAHTGYLYSQGHITKQEAVIRTASSAGGTAGGLGGAAAGAAIGTMIAPGVGTLIGGFIGGVAGGCGGRRGAEAALNCLA